jgi:hypothetical protein
MKPTCLTPFFALAALTFAGPAWAQEIPLRDLIAPNNQIHDAQYGVSFTVPAGWDVRGAQRWGQDNKENTIFLSAVWPSESRPSIYYAPIREVLGPGQAEEYFRRTAVTKADSRVKGGMRDYANVPESFVMKKINGRETLCYHATFSRGPVKMVEYFTRIAGDKVMVMLFAQLPLEEFATLKPELDQMMATAKVP